MILTFPIFLLLLTFSGAGVLRFARNVYGQFLDSLKVGKATWQLTVSGFMLAGALLGGYVAGSDFWSGAGIFLMILANIQAVVAEIVAYVTGIWNWAVGLYKKAKGL